MLKNIHHLSENPSLVPLLLDNKICLAGIEQTIKQEALLEGLNKWYLYEPFWR